jgi:predicted nucleic acid-binding protein
MKRGRESRRVFVDSNGFAGIGIKGDVHNRDSITILRDLTLAGRSMVTTNFIVAEMHSVVLGRAGRFAALNVLDLINNSVELVERVTEEDEDRAVAILRQYDDKAFSYTDATSFAVMRRLGLTDVFTFDRHFEQFGFSPLKPT